MLPPLPALALVGWTALALAHEGATDVEPSAQEPTGPVPPEERYDPRLDPARLRAYWRDGLVVENRDRSLQIRFGAEAQLDWVFNDQSTVFEIANGDEEDGTEFRRVRFGVGGRLLHALVFKTELDFVADEERDGGDVELADVYVGFDRIPTIGEILFGNVKEPMGLENLTRNTDTLFMERSQIEALTPGRNVGVLARNHFGEEHITLAVGAFRETDGTGDGGKEGEFAYTGRLTFLPWWEPEVGLLHFGVSGSYRMPENPVTFEARAETDQLPAAFNSTAPASVDELLLYGGEVALVLGPFTAQGEYMLADAEGASDIAAPDFRIDGWYGQLAWNITGEMRPYDTSRGVFDRMRPISDFRVDRLGAGAWQLATRYSTYDATDLVGGDDVQTVAAALSWYINPHARIIGEYAMLDPEDEGHVKLAMARFQIDI